MTNPNTEIEILKRAWRRLEITIDPEDPRYYVFNDLFASQVNALREAMFDYE